MLATARPCKSTVAVFARVHPVDTGKWRLFPEYSVTNTHFHRKKSATAWSRLMPPFGGSVAKMYTWL